MSRSDRFFAIYVKPDSAEAIPSALNEFARFAQYTLILNGKDTADVCIDGNAQSAVSRLTLEESLRNAQRIAFSIWSKESTGLFVTISRADGVSRIDFSLDGTTQSEGAALVEAAINTFVLCASERFATAIIIDPSGHFAESPWPQMILGTCEVEFAAPARVLVSRGMTAGMNINLNKYTCRYLVGQVIEVVPLQT